MHQWQQGQQQGQQQSQPPAQQPVSGEPLKPQPEAPAFGGQPNELAQQAQLAPEAQPSKGQAQPDKKATPGWRKTDQSYSKPDLRKKPVIISPADFDAVLFDMDGVVTKTASVHAAAWKAVFDHFLQSYTPVGFCPFDIDQDYLRYVDGKPRYDGVRSFLASRDILLPDGNPEDPPGLGTICAIGNLKNNEFQKRLEQHEVEPYETTIALIQSLKRKGIKVAVITASENGQAVMQAANMTHLFAAKVDGVDARRLHLKGKPEPDPFLEAAKELNVSPSRAVVVEDAEAGVEAGRKGGFGLVIGVDRNNHAAALKTHGADVVVNDLADVGVPDQLAELPGMALADLEISDRNWILAYHEFNPELEGRRESLCALGNGYFETRGAAPESIADGVHYPGTYLAGAYNRIKREAAGLDFELEDLVNMPNWLPLSFRIGDDDWFDLGQVKILSYKQALNLREGILYRKIHFRDKKDRETTLTERRFVHMQHFHLAGLETKIVAHNWSEHITVRSALDGRVVNAGTPETKMYGDEAHKHLQPLESNVIGKILYLKMQTMQSQIAIAEAASTRLYRNDIEMNASATNIADSDYVAQELTFPVEAGVPYTIQKTVSLFSSRDYGISEAGLAAHQALINAPDFDTLVSEQMQVWRHLWRRFDLSLETRADSSRTQLSLILHLHSFHALQTASPNSVDLDIGVPARGWTGEGYQGHIFWDDLFVFPFLNLRMPDITQALLKYRYRRLNEARRSARKLGGVPGARYPWQSGSCGREETPKYLWIKNKQLWIRDYSHLAVHVNAAIAYNIWQYYQVTGNLEFMYSYGAEMLLEIARFFAHFAKYNPLRDRYEIQGIIGPDEYHTAYPNSDKPGINNNAYTNIMAVWTLCRALDIIKVLPEDHCNEICQRLSLSAAELELWKQVSRKMFVPLMENGIISQFEGYEKLQEFPHGKDGRLDLLRLDKVLQEQNGYVNQYQVTKQADVLMLFYVFSAQELAELFKHLGYTFDTESISENVGFYINRTHNKSSLSRIAHAWVLSRMDRLHAWKMLSYISPQPASEPIVAPDPQARSWDVFQEALDNDFFDIQGGTTAEGIHMGSMAGTVDIVQRCYTGIVTRQDVLWLNPCLPEELTRLSFHLHYRLQAVRIEITQQKVRVSTGHSSALPIKIGFRDKIYELHAGESRCFHLETGEPCE